VRRWWGRCKASNVKLYISKHFSEKCVTRRGYSCHPQFKFILLSLVTTQCTTLLIGINKQIMYSTVIYGSPTDPRVGAIINLSPKSWVIYSSVHIHLAPKTSIVYNSSTYWNMVCIWITNNLLRNININTI
jgi:hypothetical protein